MDCLVWIRARAGYSQVPRRPTRSDTTDLDGSTWRKIPHDGQTAVTRADVVFGTHRVEENSGTLRRLIRCDGGSGVALDRRRIDRWEGDGHSGAAAGTFGDGDVAAVSSGDLARDGEPEAGGSAAASAAVVQPDEPVEDSFPVSLANAGAVVGDVDPHAVGLGPRGDDDAGAGEAGRLPGDVGEQSPQWVRRSHWGHQ